MICQSMANHNSACNEVISLNVGGVIHITTRSTLTKYPDSMLASMFSGHFVPTAFDNQGNYFIDRDGQLFRHVLNFLRTGRLCLPQDFKDFDILEAEADFYQIPSLISAVAALRCPSKNQAGHYLEILDFEECAYFYRFYSDPPQGINAELKNGGIVISGATSVIKGLPLPDKTLKDLEKYSDIPYRTVNINSNMVSKMALIHHLHANGWELLKTSFANNHDSDGSYMVHKYMWFLPT